MNQGVHTVDLLLWLMGDIRDVYAHTRTALHEIEVEDTVVACLEFASGAVGALEATTAAYPGFPRRLELTGSNGTVVVEENRVSFVGLHSGPDEPPPDGTAGSNESASSATVSDVSAHRAVLEDFLDAVANDREPLCNGREARRSVAVVEAIYQSARDHRPVAPH